MYSVYSLMDVKTVLNHPDVGRAILSAVGGGRVTISYAGDLATNTVTATGYVVVNKLCSKNGSIGLEIPANSVADQFLSKWVQYVKNAPTNRFALATFQLDDPAGKKRYNMTGVVPQKDPDKGFDQTSGNRQYNLLFADITESAI